MCVDGPSFGFEGEVMVQNSRAFVSSPRNYAYKGAIYFISLDTNLTGHHYALVLRGVKR